MQVNHILIVDDEPDILDSLSMMLNLEGYHVQTVSRSQAVLASENKSAPPDLILLDIWLSGEDGRDVCRKIRQNNTLRTVPVVMMSAGQNMAESALEAGANAFIAKPFNPDDLLETIRKIA